MSQRKLILVADGAEETLILFHQVLRRVGYDVVLAATAEEALAQARKHQPDLVLLDPALDGAGTPTRPLLEHAARVGLPVAALAADAQQGRDGEGFCAVVQKRMPLKSLLAAIRRCLDASRLPELGPAATPA